MEENKDIASEYTKRDKVLVESLWQELTQSLNSVGPPSKDVNGWKKIWTEWKSEIKKKLAHNKSESRATGGGPFTKFQLTPTEEAIVRMCGMKTNVDGVAGIELGTDNEVEHILNELTSDSATTSNTTTTSTNKRKLDAPICSTTKRSKPQCTAAFFENFWMKTAKERMN